jgi:hypothetical protein
MSLPLLPMHPERFAVGPIPSVPLHVLMIPAPILVLKVMAKPDVAPRDRVKTRMVRGLMKIVVLEAILVREATIPLGKAPILNAQSRNHSQPNHSQPNHSQPNHSQHNHSQHNHSQHNHSQHNRSRSRSQPNRSRSHSHSHPNHLNLAQAIG